MYGNPLDTTTVYDLGTGDYIECGAAEPISEDYPPSFVWWRSIQVSNDNGPKVISYRNTDDNRNRYFIKEYSSRYASTIISVIAHRVGIC